MPRPRLWITLASQVVHELQVAPTRMAINMAIGGEKFEDAAVSTLRQGTGHAIGATLAHQIGQLYQGPDKLDYFTHKLAHFAAGALGGTIAGNDPLGGGLGAAFAEVAMEAMTDAEAISDELYLENPTMNDEEFKAAFREKTMAKRYFSQVIGGFVGTLAGDGNFGVAASTAAIALDYNMSETMSEKAKESYMEAQQFVEGRVDETLTSLEKAQKRPYTAEEKAQVRDNLRKFYMRSYLDYKASGLLVEGVKLNPSAGAIITSAEVAYGYATGDMDAYEAVTGMVGATSSLAGRMGRLVNMGTKVHDATTKKESVSIKADEYEDIVGLKGEYRSVKGHHVHAKKAFDGHVNYDSQKGFSISINIWNYLA